jgi:hypothetical protein
MQLYYKIFQPSLHPRCDLHTLLQDIKYIVILFLIRCIDSGLIRRSTRSTRLVHHISGDFLKFIQGQIEPDGIVSSPALIL